MLDINPHSDFDMDLWLDSALFADTPPADHPSPDNQAGRPSLDHHHHAPDSERLASIMDADHFMDSSADHLASTMNGTLHRDSSADHLVSLMHGDLSSGSSKDHLATASADLLESGRNMEDSSDDSSNAPSAMEPSMDHFPDHRPEPAASFAPILDGNHSGYSSGSHADHPSPAQSTDSSDDHFAWMDNDPPVMEHSVDLAPFNGWLPGSPAYRPADFEDDSSEHADHQPSERMDQPGQPACHHAQRQVDPRHLQDILHLISDTTPITVPPSMIEPSVAHHHGDQPQATGWGMDASDHAREPNTVNPANLNQPIVAHQPIAHQPITQQPNIHHQAITQQPITPHQAIAQAGNQASAIHPIVEHARAPGTINSAILNNNLGNNNNNSGDNSNNNTNADSDAEFRNLPSLFKIVRHDAYKKTGVITYRVQHKQGGRISCLDGPSVSDNYQNGDRLLWKYWKTHTIRKDIVRLHFKKFGRDDFDKWALERFLDL